MSARYWIAKHIEDPFRDEPRNIGILVEHRGGVAARFMGETVPGQVDGRKVRGLRYPDVYKQWVEFWRGELRVTSLDALAAEASANYRLAFGGVVDDVGDDSAEGVADYLYALLVSDGGLSAALGITDEERSSGASLVNDVAEAFDAAGILEKKGASLFVPHPILRAVPIQGATGVQHKPAFVQQNGKLSMIETVDFSGRLKRAPHDHAGWAAYMFRDIRARIADAESFAIVRATAQDQAEEEVVNGLALIKHEATVIDWLDSTERDAFLRTRRKEAAG